MPADALPVPRVEPVAELSNLRKTYRDVLGRPLVGEVTISGAQRAAAGDAVVVPADVKVRITDGVLEVSLPPGTYNLAASLRTVDGVSVTDREDVMLD